MTRLNLINTDTLISEDELTRLQLQKFAEMCPRTRQLLLDLSEDPTLDTLYQLIYNLSEILKRLEKI